MDDCFDESRGSVHSPFAISAMESPPRNCSTASLISALDSCSSSILRFTLLHDTRFFIFVIINDSLKSRWCCTLCSAYRTGFFLRDWCDPCSAESYHFRSIASSLSDSRSLSFLLFRTKDLLPILVSNLILCLLGLCSTAFAHEDPLLSPYCKYQIAFFIVLYLRSVCYYDNATMYLKCVQPAVFFECFLRMPRSASSHQYILHALSSCNVKDYLLGHVLSFYGLCNVGEVSCNNIPALLCNTHMFFLSAVTPPQVTIVNPRTKSSAHV